MNFLFHCSMYPLHRYGQTVILHQNRRKSQDSDGQPQAAQNAASGVRRGFPQLPHSSPYIEMRWCIIAR
jgi:hypothetical protein